MISENVKNRAKKLVSEMTVEEKCSQLRYDSPSIERLGIPAYNWWNEGLHGLARAGTATMFPQAIAVAATFDEELTRLMAEVVGKEARAKYNASSKKGDRDIYKGLTIWSPNINIFRDPRWGRGHETYGEDPYLTSVMGCSYVKGLQGNGEYMTASACAKHFAVHSGPENLRHEFDAICTEKELHETYLYAFKKLVESDVSGVMGAYNRVMGEPSCASKKLMDILKNEWGYDGYFVSDCWAIQDFHLHHKVTSNFVESAALALKTGCDVNCGCSYAYVLQAYNEGLVTIEDIDRSVTKLFEIRIALGMFDKTELDDIPYTVIDCKEHNELSRKIAEKSMVLLKNDGILPFNKDKIKTLAVIGCSADNIDSLKGNYYGTASGYTTFLQGIKNKCGDDIRVLYSEGCHIMKDRCEGLAQSNDRISEAVTTAEYSDVVVLCVGLDEHIEGEEGDQGNEYASGDKTTLLLPESQRRLIKAVLDTGKPTVVVISAGSSVVTGDDRENALICAWYSGPHGGTALADILFGDVSPSGKLPVTFYKDTDSLPEFTDYSMKNRTYKYLQDDSNVLYPFGFGLTYSEFTSELISVESTEKGKVARVKVQNVGKYDSDEVIQLYVSSDDKNAPLNPWLCGFRRINLKQGESRIFEIEIPEDILSIYDDSGRTYFAEDYKFFAGFGQIK